MRVIMPEKHKVLIHAVCEITITNDDPAEAKAIAGRLFEDDIASKSEMFSVRVEKVEVDPHSSIDRGTGC